MNLFIKVDESNNPQNHPVVEVNLQQLYPSTNLSVSVPAGWLRFERLPIPTLGVYQKFDDSIGGDVKGLEYKVIDGIVKDVWHVLDLTDDEKKAKQDAVKADWAAQDPAGPASWTFSEATCSYEPPVAHPNDGKNYYWDEDTTSWVEAENT
tara:strand:- start:243 stop:695 length:453 start_codon:yes stop_codon:yes gene_type:complete